MTNTEFESRIAQIMNDNVNQQLAGSDRRGPTFDQEHGSAAETARGTLRWMLPLTAAAAMVGIGVGALALVATHTTAVSTNSSNPASTSHVSSTKLTSTSGPARTRPTVTLGGAHIVLPVGWVALDLGLSVDSSSAHVWCLAPAGVASSTDCPVTFGPIDPNADRVDVDLEGGWFANPHFCFEGTDRKSVEQASDRPFGGRTSDWRHWSITCTGHDFEIEQYVIATNPGFIMYSADATMRAVMSEIARNSSLPAQTSSLRLNDRGYLRSVMVEGQTARVVIDRAIPLEPSGVINKDPATYTYDVPLSMYRDANAKVGTLVAVYTNGETVRDFYRS